MENKLKFSKNEYLIINPNYNVYKESEPFYDIANTFLNLPLPHYIDTIKNASKVIVTDSSFFCLSLYLNIHTNECYYKSRNNVDYTIITSDTKFKKIN